MIKGFTIQRILISRDGTLPMRKCAKHHYTWSESDLIYYNDESDEDWFDDVPVNGEYTFCFKLGYKARLKVVVDRKGVR